MSTATLKWRKDFGDLDLDASSGQFKTVSGVDKLAQDIRQNIQTVTQADGTGADLNDLVGSLVTSLELRTEITSRIRDAFKALQDLQKSIQSGDRDRTEKFGSLDSVEVNEVKSDRTAYTVRVLIRAPDRTTTATWNGVLTR